MNAYLCIRQFRNARPRQRGSRNAENCFIDGCCCGGESSTLSLSLALRRGGHPWSVAAVENRDLPWCRTSRNGNVQGAKSVSKIHNYVRIIKLY